MARVAVALLAVLGLLLSAAGMIAALAVGIPALGLNSRGRNPVAFTLVGLAFAAMLYFPGAGFLWVASNLMRKGGWWRIEPFALVAIVLIVSTVPLALRGYWLGIAMLLVTLAGIALPVVLGLRPWVDHLNAGTGRR